MRSYRSMSNPKRHVSLRSPPEHVSLMLHMQLAVYYLNIRAWAGSMKIHVPAHLIDWGFIVCFVSFMSPWASPVLQGTVSNQRKGLSLFVSVCMFVCIRVDNVWLQVDARGQTHVPLFSYITLGFEMGSLTDQEPIEYTRLTEQQATGICLSLPPQCMNYKCVSLWPAFW